jgi:Tfp pilus assembly protein PilZ
MTTFKVQIAATLVSRSQTTALLTEHVSPQGVFVRTDSPPPIGALLRIEFVLPSTSAPVVMNGVAKRVVPPHGTISVPGVELEFFAKDGGGAGQLWDQFIRYVGEKYPESVLRAVMLAQDANGQAQQSIPIRASSGTAVAAVVDELSAGGMFLKTAEPFRLGSILRVTLEDPRNGTQTQLACMVRRRVTGAKQGIGVELMNTSHAQRAALTDLVRAAGPAGSLEAECVTVGVPRAPQRTAPVSGVFVVGVLSASGTSSEARVAEERSVAGRSAR